jgi:hypothetical protein
VPPLRIDPVTTPARASPGPVARSLLLDLAAASIAGCGKWQNCDDRQRHARPGGAKHMSKRDELISKYAEDLRTKCRIEPDMALLTKVTIGCGPAIYNADSSTLAGTEARELETVKANFLIRKLGLADGPKLMEAITAVIDTYGKSERNKYRAVVYYMLVKHFGKEGVYA